MRKLTLIVAAVVVWAVLQPGLPHAVAQSDASFQGRVCSLDWSYSYEGEWCQGSGLPGVTVAVHQDGALPGGLDDVDESATSDAWGWFHIGGLEAGTYEVTMSREGFETRTFNVQVPHEKGSEWNLQGETVTVSGSVSSTGGGAVPGAVLHFEHDDETVQVQTAGDGSYSALVTAGHHSVRVQHDSHHGLRVWDLLIDGQGSHDFKLEKAPERTVRLDGTLVDQDGNPVAGADVRIDQYQCCVAYETAASDGQADGSSSYSYRDDSIQLVTDSQGRFSTKLYPGEAYVNVWKDGYASLWKELDVPDRSSMQVNLELLKYPEKTAKIEGRAVGADGKALKHVYVNIDSPQYGLWECSSRGDEPQVMMAEARAEGDSIAPYPYPGCAITVNDDGTFEGFVTPGYAIVRISYDYWATCTETQDSTGFYQRQCGQQYFQDVSVRDLAADATTRIDVQLIPRPGPDAIVSGYVLDSETDQPLSGVEVSFSNQETYSWASARTDKDGSFRVQLRSGVTDVYVDGPDHLRWQDTLRIRSSDADQPLDIHMVRGNDAHGGCCYIYGREAVDHAVASDGGSGASGPSGSSGAGGAPIAGPEIGSPGGFDDAGTGGSDDDFRDLGGGLGPYDKNARAKALSDFDEEQSPGVALVLVLGLLAAVAIGRRR